MSIEPRAINILVAALGGEGGGVLADWLIAAATLSGHTIQSTSIPGVAQRTGATTYYLEIFPDQPPSLLVRRPVLALTPTPGDVDLVAATELVEAGRCLQNAFVTPQRTTLLASTQRVYAIGEKATMADGRFDAGRIVAAANALARRAILFDMTATAQRAAAPINAVLFGAMIGSGVLPLSRAMAEAAIRRTGKSIDANLRGFVAGFAQAQQPSSAASEAADAIPPAAQEVIALGMRRLTQYQNAAYAELYQRRLGPIMLLDQRSGSGDFALTRETARHLALWMSYEDVIRVAALKTAAGRLGRIREEVRAPEGSVVRVTDFLKPGLDELCSILPARAGRALLAWARGGLEDRLNVGLYIRSTSVAGFLILRCLAALRWWRPHSLRHHEEQQRIERWLDAVSRAAAHDGALALEIAECAQLVKGYGDTHRRGVGNFERIAEAWFDRDFASCDTAAVADAIRRAREAALADPEGAALQSQLAILPAAPTRPAEPAAINS